MPRELAAERRKSYCPQCVTGRGVPSGVAFSPGQKTIFYTCPDCGHQWQVRASLSTGNAREVPGE